MEKEILRLTGREAEIMRILWNHKEATASQINDSLPNHPDPKSGEPVPYYK